MWTASGKVKWDRLPFEALVFFPRHYRQIRTGVYITRISLFSFIQQHFKKELNNLERVKNEYMRKNAEQVSERPWFVILVQVFALFFRTTVFLFALECARFAFSEKSHELLWQNSHVKTDLKMVFWELPCKTVFGDGALIFHECVLLSDPRIGVMFGLSGSRPLVRVAWEFSSGILSSILSTNVSIDLPLLAVSTIRRILTSLMSDVLFFPVLIGQNYRRICLQIQRPSSGAGNIDSSSTVSGTISDMSHSRDLAWRLYLLNSFVSL